MKTLVLSFLLYFTLSTEAHALRLKKESSFSQATNILEPGSFWLLNYYTPEGTAKSLLIVKKSAKNLNELEKEEKNFLYLDFETASAIHSNSHDLEQNTSHKNLLNKSINYSEAYFWNFFTADTLSSLTGYLGAPLKRGLNYYIFDPLSKYFFKETDSNENENSLEDNKLYSYSIKITAAILYILNASDNPNIQNSFIGYLYKASRLVNVYLNDKIEHLFTKGSFSHLSNSDYCIIRNLKIIFFKSMTQALLHAAEDIFFETLDQVVVGPNQNKLSVAQIKALQDSIHFNSIKPVVLKVSDEVFENIQKQYLHVLK